MSESGPLGPSRNILLAGYWPPTNRMLSEFSKQHNEGGWKGGNWRGHGFDVHAHYPQFDTEGPHYGPGFGELRVDYQDTSQDWWPIANRLRPVAIITFSLSLLEHTVDTWELEAGAANRESWADDYEDPREPTPSPPDDSVPPGFERRSSLPMELIRDRVDASDLDVDAFIDEERGAGRFLSEFLAYHGMWYRALHDNCDLHTRCIAAGHIHVGWGVEVEEAREATKITLEAVIEHVQDHLTDCLSLRQVAVTCGGRQLPLSVQEDLFGGRGPHHLRGRLVELMSDCR